MDTTWLYLALPLLIAVTAIYFGRRHDRRQYGGHIKVTPPVGKLDKRKQREWKEATWDAEFRAAERDAAERAQALYFTGLEDPRCYRCHRLFAADELQANTCQRCLAGQLGAIIMQNPFANHVEMGTYRQQLTAGPFIQLRRKRF